LHSPVSTTATPIRLLPASRTTATMSISKTMKAIVIEKTGGPEVIQLKTDLPVPAVADEDVLIKIEWAGVNLSDTYVRSGLYQAPLPKILGHECAGKVVAVGASVDSQTYGYTVGDTVAAYATGCIAEYASVKGRKTCKLPDGISAKDGSTILLQGLTALTFMTEAHPVKKGEWILVHAAAGGLGLLLCQLASHLGAHVIGTTSSLEKAAVAKALGAEHVVLYGPGHPPVPEQVLKLTGGEGVHAVFDGVGKDTWEGNFESVRRKGSIVSVGNASGVAPPFPPLKLSAKNLKLTRPRLDNYVATPEEWRLYTDELFKLYKAGAFKITRYLEDGYLFTEDAVQQAHIDISGRKTTGKLVVHIA